MRGGGTASFVGLPNSGIIVRYDYGLLTDTEGRVLEEARVAPHIANLWRMDALQSVLALIGDGDY